MITTVRKPLIKTDECVGTFRSMNRPSENVYICPECLGQVAWTKSKAGKSYLCDVGYYTTNPFEGPGREVRIYLPMSPHYKTCAERVEANLATEVEITGDTREVILARKAEAEAEAEAKRLGRTNVGEVGEKITVTGNIVKAYERDGAYGTTQHVVVENAEGNLVEAGGTAAWLYMVEVGDQVTMTGTVKKHLTGKDGKVTVLTRTKKTEVAS